MNEDHVTNCYYCQTPLKKIKAKRVGKGSGSDSIIACKNCKRKLFRNKVVLRKR